MKNALIILNPIAGARRGADLSARLRRMLLEEGVDATITETARRGDAETIAREEHAHYDMVVGAGGDGTVNEVASGLHGTDTPLGILPLGTANVLARELGIPLGMKGACRVLASGVPRAIDVGLALFPSRNTGHPFLSMAGAGLDAAVAHAYKAVRRKSSRYHQYVVPILLSIRDFHFPEIHVSLDGRPLAKPATSVIAGNIRTYGGPFRPTPHAEPDDGLLHVCAVHVRNTRDLLRCLWGTMTGRHIDYPDVTYATAREVRIESGDHVRVQLDGDAVGRLPVQLSILPRGLSVIAPGV
ncbi:MAG: diacylglycerol kinase family lipid kinase [Planctomycetes bacterium]|nr:diacylglycerol kinase family lipid kinase [Planctomycetota bacterium]